MENQNLYLSMFWIVNPEVCGVIPALSIRFQNASQRSHSGRIAIVLRIDHIRSGWYRDSPTDLDNLAQGIAQRRPGYAPTENHLP